MNSLVQILICHSLQMSGNLQQSKCWQHIVVWLFTTTTPEPFPHKLWCPHSEHWSCTDPVSQAQLQEEAVSRYISTHHMDTCGWGTDFEIMLLASLTIQIFSFSTHGESRQWVCYAPGFTRNRLAWPYGVYVYVTNNHYDRVIPILHPPQ